MKAGIAEARDDESTGIRVERRDLAHERRNRRLDVLLRLDAGRTVGERVALDARTLGEAQRLEGFVHGTRDRLEGVRIDDMDCRAHHRVILAQ